MRRRFVFFTIALLLAAGKPAYAEDVFRAESLSSVVKQGEVCLIRASGPASLRSIYGEFRGERFPFAFNEKNRTYEGLIGIDMSTPSATYEIKAIATDEEGKVHSSALSLRVEKADFGVEKLSLPREMVELDTKTLERVDREERRLQTLFQTFRDEKLWSGPFIRPVGGELSATFGLNRIINGQQRSAHTGIDLRADEGVPVLACNSGVVVLVDELFFTGKSVLLDHGWGLYSMYFHLSETLVKEGDRVDRGATLGRVRSTRRSTGPHLHWEIRINEARIDPLSILKIFD